MDKCTQATWFSCVCAERRGTESSGVGSSGERRQRRRQTGPVCAAQERETQHRAMGDS